MMSARETAMPEAEKRARDLAQHRSTAGPKEIGRFVEALRDPALAVAKSFSARG